MRDNEETEPIEVHKDCPDCGHHKCLSVYEDHTYCFSCQKYTPVTGETKMVETKEHIEIPGSYRDIPDRFLTEDTCKKFGVKTLKKDGKIVQHMYPYYDDKKRLIAFKVRKVKTKEFFFQGDSKSTSLFGKALFPAKGKIITITEGELDAMSAYQMFDSKYPFVSLPKGAAGASKAMKDNYDYLNSFDEIRLCFDGDEAGRQAAVKAAEVLPPMKVKIIKLPENMKDASEYLKAGKTMEFKSIFWKAEEYRPEDIVNLGDKFNDLLDFQKNHKTLPTPWAGLNEMIEGVSFGQLCILAAGTGMGKSAFMKSWLKYLLDTTEYRIGGVFFEEQTTLTALSLLSLEMGANLRRKDVWKMYPEKELREAFDAVCGNRRIELLERTERSDPEYVVDRIRYLAKARDCKIIFFDHITYVADDLENVTKELNKLTKLLHELATSLDIVIIAACHLRKATGKLTHEEGGRVTLDDLKDASSLKQYPDLVLALERNSQETDEKLANTTAIRILKNRDYGTKGIAAAVFFDKETTRLTEVDKSVLLENDELADITR